jgi:O-antigen/teichoic acid export membrane protein
VVLTVAWGGLQGTHHFTAFSLGQVGYAVLKLAAAVGVASAGAAVGGVMWAIAAATVVTLVAIAVPLLPYLRASAHASLRRRPLVTRYSGGAGASLTLFAAMTTLDVLVARVTLTPNVAGAYAAASVIARGVLLIPTAITTVLFPHVSTLGDAARERRHLLGATAATVGAALVPVVLLLAAGDTIVKLLFGARYVAAGSWAGPLAAAMALYSIAFVYLFHSLSIGRTRFWLAALPALALQLAGFAAFHDSARELIGVQLVAAAVLAVVGELYDRRTS